MKRTRLQFMVIFSMVVVFSTVYAQSRKLSKKEQERITQEISELEKKYREEKSFFDSFEKQKQALIEQRKKEKIDLQKDIQQLRMQTASVKGETAQQDRIIRSIEARIKEYEKSLRNLLVTLKVDVEKGIPFQIQTRLATVASMILDLDSGKASINEVFNRLLAFLEEEEVLGYDSQVVPILVEIQGKSMQGTLLRLGRVFFSVDVGSDIYLYEKDFVSGGYVLAKQPVGLQTRLLLRRAVKVVEGKSAPDFVSIPITITGGVK